MGVPVRDFLRRRRDRALATILNHAESNLYERLTPQERKALRSCVIEALNSYHDAVLDLMHSEDDQYTRNDEALAVLEAAADRAMQRVVEQRVSA
jgi:hypothetical protein